MKKYLKDFIADESGATAIEYGLIAAGISLAIIAVVNGLGTKHQDQVHVDQHIAEVIAIQARSGLSLQAGLASSPGSSDRRDASHCVRAAGFFGRLTATPTVWLPGAMLRWALGSV